MFADLAGFTALTEARGDEPAADLVEAFSRLVSERLPPYRAHQIKLIGDAIMLRVPNAGDAVALGLTIVFDIGCATNRPPRASECTPDTRSSEQATGMGPQSISQRVSHASPAVARYC